MSDPDRSGTEPTGHATFREPGDGPERMADAAEIRPGRIGRPGRGDPVSPGAAELDRLTDPGRTRSMHISELSERDLELLREQDIPEASRAFDREGGFVEHD